jgi:hypothetical protein
LIYRFDLPIGVAADSSPLSSLLGDLSDKNMNQPAPIRNL